MGKAGAHGIPITKSAAQRYRLDAFKLEGMERSEPSGRPSEGLAIFQPLTAEIACPIRPARQAEDQGESIFAAFIPRKYPENSPKTKKG